MALDKQHVLFIGAGRMAQAIIEGLKNKEEFGILVTNNGNNERLSFVRETFNVETTDNWKTEADRMDIIVLAMPPEAHESILKELSGLINGQLVMTVAAGIKPSFLEGKLPHKTPVVWVMPNTAAKIGRSITLFAVGNHISEKHIETIQALIGGIGEYEQVTEQQIEDLTAVTSSSPAFIYRIAEALEKVTLETGVTPQQARRLVAEMIAGSAAMLKTGTEPKELVNQVATPGGSTEAGLEVLAAHQMDLMIIQAIEACRARAKAD